jgi:polyisoprenyl-teichoic acid--peptidoglycan teichoic acid transferase
MVKYLTWILYLILIVRDSMNRKDFKKKKKRKKKRRFKILSIFLLLIVGFAGYTFYQYYDGLKTAGEGIDTNFQSEEFNGAKSDGKINVLLLGVDSRGEEKSRTDTIMVAQYDPETQTAKLVSIMRDIYVEIPGYNNYKVNTAYFLGGAELLRETLKENFDLDLHYYALIDFQGFEKAVDTLAPNGIEMDVEKSMSKNIGVTLEPGLQDLNGKELLGYARYRADAEGDFGRVQRQQEVINALVDEMISVNGVTKLPKLVGTVQPFVQSNLGGSEVVGLMKDFLLNKPENIETLRIPVEDSYTNASYSEAGAVLEIDKEKNKQALEEFLK